ncbi:hypothetical protein [Exiguobacterium sp. SH3S1]|uniref:hypothetical protein n=1 Tax=Exiguobacterium sp. SH3S1 TaxID=2510955 RepID=UPI00103B241F|nr:hypothetical protein [Exiguobacterium sp. SH3S1]TCI59282.1 hypothetical protein EVJ26_12900 [Exiguobacterium sp. SH3S1]
MKRNQQLVLIIVVVLLLSARIVWKVESTEQPELSATAEPILVHQVADPEMTIRFFTERYSTDELSDELFIEGIGLEITIDDRVESVTSRSLSDDGLTWSVDGRTCGDELDCAPFDILYGMNHGTTTRVVVELNGERFEPELMKTKSGNDVWFVVVDQIESIDAITGYDAAGDVSYRFNN